MKLHEYLTKTSTKKKDFADLVGCTEEAVRLWCLGRRVPRPETMQQIERVTKGKVGWVDFKPSEAAA